MGYFEEYRPSGQEVRVGVGTQYLTRVRSLKAETLEGYRQTAYMCLQRQFCCEDKMEYVMKIFWRLQRRILNFLLIGV